MEAVAETKGAGMAGPHLPLDILARLCSGRRADHVPIQGIDFALVAASPACAVVRASSRPCVRAPARPRPRLLEARSPGSRSRPVNFWKTLRSAAVSRSPMTAIKNVRHVDGARRGGLAGGTTGGAPQRSRRAHDRRRAEDGRQAARLAPACGRCRGGERCSRMFQDQCSKVQRRDILGDRKAQAVKPAGFRSGCAAFAGAT
jgi:hypothetical protein